MQEPYSQNLPVRHDLYNDQSTPVQPSIPDYNQVLYETIIRYFLHATTIKVYVNRISIESRSGIGLWENRKTYSATDIGNIYIRKGRNKAIVGATRINSDESLFQIQGLNSEAAEIFKDTLDYMLWFRQFRI